ncbi:hypothetical protein [Moorella sp. ACPs]|uniref:hypothetical protein n=1 Tax=Neomoorella carbonis TaxID=3062783 RepID=UPI0038732A53
MTAGKDYFRQLIPLILKSILLDFFTVDAGISNLSSAFPCRFHPTARRLRQENQAGKLGRVVAIRATNHGSLPPAGF